MLRLALSDLLHSPKTWLGLFIFAITCGCMCQFSFLLIHSAESHGLMFSRVGTGMLLLTVIPSLPIASALSNLVVERQRYSYALWQLAGVSPRVVRRSVLVQLGLIGGLGAAFGASVSALLYEPVLPLVLPDLLDRSSSVAITFYPSDLLETCIYSMFVFVIGGHGSARRASSTSPIAVLSSTDCPTQKVPVLRILLSTFCLAVTVYLFLTMTESSMSTVTNAAFFLPIAITACMSTLAPWLLPPMLRFWTVPLKLNILLRLSREEACYTLASSTSIELAIMTCFGMISGISSSIRVLSSWYTASGSSIGTTINQTAKFILFVCPAIVCLIGVAACTLAAADDHKKFASTLVLIGFTRREIVVISLGESLIHAANALILGAASAIISTLLNSFALGTHPFEDLDLSAGPFIGIAGVLLISWLLCFSSAYGARLAMTDINAVARDNF